jgi:hypothetical protein
VVIALGIPSLIGGRALTVHDRKAFLSRCRDAPQETSPNDESRRGQELVNRGAEDRAISFARGGDCFKRLYALP